MKRRNAAPAYGINASDLFGRSICPRSAAAALRRLLTAFLAFCLSLGASVSAQLNPLTSPIANVWSHTGFVSDGDLFAVGDLEGNGELDILFVREAELRRLRPDLRVARRERETALQLPSSVGRPTALVLADLNGDGRDEVWVGTEAPGHVQVFSYASGVLEPIGGTMQSLFGDVAEIIPVDVDGDGALDLVALNHNGVLFLYRWQAGGGFTRVWSSSRQTPHTMVQAVDLTGDGRHVIAAVRDDGIRDATMALYGWTENGMGVLSEHPVWQGAVIHSFSVAPFGDGKGRQALVGTSEGSLRTYDIRPDGTFLPRLNLLSGAPSRVDWQGVGDLTGSGIPQWLTLTSGRLTAWRVGPSGIVRVWEGDIDAEKVRAFRTDRGYLLGAVSGERISLYAPIDETFLRVEFRHRSVLPHDEPLFLNGQPALSLRDWSEVTGMRVWLRGGGAFTGFRGFQFFIGHIGSRELNVNGRRVELAEPVQMHNELVYMPAEVLSHLGLSVDWKPQQRLLLIE